MKEKLIELLNEVQFCPYQNDDDISCDMCKWNDALIHCRALRQADHLIANGVTVRAKGEWESRMDKSGWLNYYACSLCGQCLADDDWNFCPNCGADMRGKEDG